MKARGGGERFLSWEVIQPLWTLTVVMGYRRDDW